MLIQELDTVMIEWDVISRQDRTLVTWDFHPSLQGVHDPCLLTEALPVSLVAPFLHWLLVGSVKSPVIEFTAKFCHFKLFDLGQMSNLTCRMKPLGIPFLQVCL